MPPPDLTDALRIRLSPPRQKIEHGPWAVQLTTDELVNLRWHDRAILRGIRAVVRDQDWRTLHPTVTSATDDEIDGARVVRLEVAYAGWGQSYSAVVSLRLTDDTASVEFEGKADAPFRGNRIGLVVLHERANAGEAVVITDPGGGETASEFPVDIQPHQPFMNVAGMRWSHDGARIDLRFSGDTFETEDQRNWTDASYKTYSTPLAQPFPVDHAAGSAVHQSLVVRVGPDAVGGDRTPSAAASNEFLVSDETVGRVPAIGLSAQTAAVGTAPASPIDGLDALLVELTGSLDERRTRLSAAQAEAAAAAVPLDVRIVAEDPAELASTLDLLELDDVIRIGVFHPRSHVTEPDLWAALKAEVQRRGFTGALVAGARSHFTELNRTVARLPPDADAVVFSITPQMHADEVERIVQTLPMQRLVAENALRLGGGRPLHIGPITLKPRFNAVATGDGYDEETRRAMITDKLQPSHFTAAWMLGGVAELSGVGGADGGAIASVSYFETRGARGIDAADGQPHPVGRLFRALAALRGRPVLRADEARRVYDSDPTIVVYPVLAESVRDGSRLIIFVGNLTAERRPATVRVGANALQLELAPWETQTLMVPPLDHATKGTLS